MGRVRTKTVKRSARTIVERYYSKLTLDFDSNKRVSEHAQAFVNRGAAGGGSRLQMEPQHMEPTRAQPRPHLADTMWTAPGIPLQ